MFLLKMFWHEWSSKAGSLPTSAHCHNGTGGNITAEVNNDWASKIPPHLIQVREALFSEEAGKFVLALIYLFEIP